MKTLLRPTFVIPLMLGAAVLAALVAVSNPAQVVAVMEGFSTIAICSLLALMLLYRVLHAVFPLAIALAGRVVLHAEVRAALRERQE